MNSTKKRKAESPKVQPTKKIKPVNMKGSPHKSGKYATKPQNQTSGKEENKVETKQRLVAQTSKELPQIDVGEVESNEDYLSKENFPASLRTAKAIEAMGFTRMTKVQAASLKPIMKRDSDVVVEANTGSGKTLAYLIPIMERLIPLKTDDPNAKGPFVLILNPIRELTLQIANDIKSLVKFHPQCKITSARIIGGQRAQGEQIAKSKPDILIATPGRLNEYLFQSNTIPHTFFQNLVVIVMDEADALTEPGFVKVVTKLLDLIPKKCQRLYFSATITRAVENLPGVQKALKISLSPRDQDDENEESFSNSVSTLKNYYVSVDAARYHIVLDGILQRYINSKVMMFCETASSIKLYVEVLSKLGYKCKGITGRMKQGLRDAAFSDFKVAKSGIYITTDVSHRGIDMNSVDLVLMVGIPQSLQSFVHRSGRTARAGKNGTCILLITPCQEKFVQDAGRRGVQMEGELKANAFIPLAKYGLDKAILRLDASIREKVVKNTTKFFKSGTKLPETNKKQMEQDLRTMYL